VYNQNSDRNWK